MKQRSVLAASDDWVRLSKNYDEHKEMSLEQFVQYLEGYPFLKPSEVACSIVTRLGELNSVVCRKLLELIAASGDDLVCHFATSLLGPPEELNPDHSS